MAGVEFGLYVAAVLFWTQEFWLPVLNYLPAAIFLMIAFLWAYRREEQRSYLLAALGLLLIFLGSALQQARVGIHPVYFSHNTLYHLVEVVALLLIFWGSWPAVMKARSEGVRC